MTKEEKLILEYFEIKNINQSEIIKVLPLTLVDLLLEYRERMILSLVKGISESQNIEIKFKPGFELNLTKCSECGEMYFNNNENSNTCHACRID